MVQVFRKLRTLVLLPPARQASICHAYLVALTVEIGIRLMALPALARGLGVSLDLEQREAPATPGASIELSPAESRAVDAAEAVFRNYPFEGTCLRRSLVLGRLLRRHHPVLRIGAARSGKSLAAHAWLEVGGVPVLDPAPEERFAPLTRGMSSAE